MPIALGPPRTTPPLRGGFWGPLASSRPNAGHGSSGPVLPPLPYPPHRPIPSEPLLALTLYRVLGPDPTARLGAAVGPKACGPAGDGMGAWCERCVCAGEVKAGCSVRRSAVCCAGLGFRVRVRRVMAVGMRLWVAGTQGAVLGPAGAGLSFVLCAEK